MKLMLNIGLHETLAEVRKIGCLKSRFNKTYYSRYWKRPDLQRDCDVMRKLFIIIFTLLLFIPSLVFAELFCVKEGGTWNSSNCGAGCSDEAAANTCMTLANFNDSGSWGSGSNKINAGDTVYFYGSITSNDIEIKGSGTSGNPITLDGYEGGDCDPINSECTSSAEIDHSGQFGIWSGYTGRDNITIQDFRVTNVLHAIWFYIGSDYITVRRNYTHETERTGIRFACDIIPGCNYITVGGASGDGNRVVNAGTDDGQNLASFTRCDDLIVSYNQFTITDQTKYGSEGVVLYTVNRALVEYNSVTDVSFSGEPGGKGIAAKGTNTDVIFRFNDTSGCDGSGLEFINEVVGGYMYGNRAHNNKYAGIILATQNELGPSEADLLNIYVWSNLIYENWGRGIALSAYGCSGATCTANNIYIYNNTIPDNGSARGENNNDAGFTCETGTNIYVKNNIFSNNVNKAGTEQEIWTNNRSNITLGDNLYYDSGGLTTLVGITMEGDAEEADPGFTDESNDDYTLDGTNVDDATDLSGCFNVTVQGVQYNMCYDDALDPTNTDFTTIPPTVSTLKRDTYGWDRGAYVYISQ